MKVLVHPGFMIHEIWMPDPDSSCKFKVCQIEHQINFILMICKGSHFLRILIKVIWKSIEKADHTARHTATHSGLRLVYLASVDRWIMWLISGWVKKYCYKWAKSIFSEKSFLRSRSITWFNSQLKQARPIHNQS